MPANSRSMRSAESAIPITCAKRGSNSASLSLPTSRSKSSWRASASWRKRWATASGSRTSARQKALKDPKTLVVRTPPKSTSRPWRATVPSSAMGDVPGALGDLGHALAEHLEERVVGGAGQQALIGALEEDRRLPQRERLIPPHVGHRASRALLVALDQLGARGEALAGGDRGEREQRAGVVARFGVGGREV